MKSRSRCPRGAVEPGSEAQIDYGKLGMWFDPDSGRRVAVWVFAMILSCSRALFIQPVLRMDQTSWNASHVAAFEFFGGVPARLVCDNLKTGVVRPDLYDPQINLAYGELAASTEPWSIPPGPANPRTNRASNARYPTFGTRFSLAGDFASIPQMQGEALRWCHRGLRAPQAPRHRRADADVVVHRGGSATR